MLFEKVIGNINDDKFKDKNPSFISYFTGSFKTSSIPITVLWDNTETELHIKSYASPTVFSISSLDKAWPDILNPRDKLPFCKIVTLIITYN